MADRTRTPPSAKARASVMEWLLRCSERDGYCTIPRAMAGRIVDSLKMVDPLIAGRDALAAKLAAVDADARDAARYRRVRIMPLRLDAHSGPPWFPEHFDAVVDLALALDKLEAA